MRRISRSANPLGLRRNSSLEVCRGDTEEEKSPTVIVHDYYHDIMSQNCSDCRNFKWQYPYHMIEKVADLFDHSGAMLAVFKRKDGVSDDEIKELWGQMGLGDT